MSIWNFIDGYLLFLRSALLYNCASLLHIFCQCVLYSSYMYLIFILSGLWNMTLKVLEISALNCIDCIEVYCVIFCIIFYLIFRFCKYLYVSYIYLWHKFKSTLLYKPSDRMGCTNITARIVAIPILIASVSLHPRKGFNVKGR